MFQIQTSLGTSEGTSVLYMIDPYQPDMAIIDINQRLTLLDATTIKLILSKA